MKVILMLSSGVLKRVLSFVRERFGRPPAPPEPTERVDVPPALPATRTKSPELDLGEQPPSPPTRGNERTILVGVDFGTSTTKVIWQDLSDNHFEVFKWPDASGRGEDSLLLPSTVTLRDRCLYFGVPESEARIGDVWLNSIKLCVLCRSKPSICRCGSTHAQSGMIRVPWAHEKIDAGVLACLFLAHVFKEVERRLIARFPGESLVLLWNVGCPMDQLDEDDRRTEWEKMAGTAMHLRSQLSEPVDGSMIATAADLMRGFVVAPAEVRNFFIQPEGLAAVKAFLQSPHAESRTYAIVDVGAGTTEVSFFFCGPIMSELGRPLRPSYLADSTEAIGGVEIDKELAEALGCEPNEARRRKEEGIAHCPRIESINGICKQYRATCCEILKKKLLTARTDKQYDLFAIGGGSRLAALRNALRWYKLPDEFALKEFRTLQPPMSLKDRESYSSNWDLLANACGLASSVYWDYYPKKDSNPMPPKPIREKLDRDTLYSR